PGSIFIFFNGYKSLAVAVLCMLGVFILNGHSVIRKRAPQLTMALFVVSLMIVIGMSLVQRGIYGAFWTFPAILLINFLASGRAARIYTAIFAVYIAAIMLYVLDLDIAARAITGLIVTILITNIFLGTIEKLQKTLVEQSSVDPLTGALNRREMDSILQEAIERKRRTRTPAALLVFDVDEFKSVNDNFGHAAGDQVLKELVSLIHIRARRLDKLFRLGGEEFMVFLPDTDGLGAVILAEELRLLVSHANFIEDRAITVSIGISELEHGEMIDEWIKRGDDALYSAKQSGRNQAVGGCFRNKPPGHSSVRPVTIPLSPSLPASLNTRI